VLIEQQTLEHRAVFFKLAVAQIREAQQEHLLQLRSPRWWVDSRRRGRSNSLPPTVSPTCTKWLAHLPHVLST
jgi:hypothetical protein